ncbi:IucA/IucC family protein [Stackebrandtia albiflava]|uniref:IucA/IucC family protein n=1 Tax=Stackebrandtia albiflava TaxID=406432 RepID=UPI001FCF15AA|nr:IucA/IucC family protein [Stackebrandtia albiflava]
MNPDGHPLHPLNRTRGGLPPERLTDWAPEHHPTVTLPLIPLTGHHHTGRDWPWHTPDRTPLLPVHPHQATHRPHLTAHATLTAAPLMSLRTLAPHHHPHLHVKTSVDLQMTSAVRHVSPAALHNGPILSRALHTLTPHTGMAVHLETATLAADHHGNPDPALAAIIRRTPPRAPGDITLPVAALTATCPDTGTPLIATVITASRLPPDRWWHHCAALLTTAPLHLATRHGIALEAHGQNTLLTLRNWRPHRLVYRDFGGVRVDPHTPALRHAPALTGDIPEPDPDARLTVLTAALYATVLRHLVHSLSHHYTRPPHHWWRPVTTHTHHHTRHHSHTHDQLFGDTWPLKATTAMRLAPDPLRNRWTPIPNPIAGHR